MCYLLVELVRERLVRFAFDPVRKPTRVCSMRVASRLLSAGVSISNRRDGLLLQVTYRLTVQISIPMQY